MPIQIEYDAVNRFVLLVYSGVNTMQDYVGGTVKVFEMFVEHGTADCLLDLRKIDNRASMAEVYDLPQLYTEMAVPRNVRISILVEPGQKDEAIIRFYETICLNRGWKANISFDAESAIAWLTGNPAA